jgi:hypothetical protein
MVERKTSRRITTASRLNNITEMTLLNFMRNIFCFFGVPSGRIAGKIRAQPTKKYGDRDH